MPSPQFGGGTAVAHCVLAAGLRSRARVGEGQLTSTLTAEPAVRRWDRSGALRSGRRTAFSRP